jgi:hypothetical protein
MDEIPTRIFVGVDRATTAHQVCVLGPDGVVLEEFSIPHSGEGLALLCARLLEHVDGVPAAAWVAIEVPHGAVVETLLERGFVVHSINPKQLDRFRDRFTVAGAKDDRRDALVLADSLRTDSRRYRRLQVDDPRIIELREWSRMGDELQSERRGGARSRARPPNRPAGAISRDVASDRAAQANPHHHDAQAILLGRGASAIQHHREHSLRVPEETGPGRAHESELALAPAFPDMDQERRLRD